MNSPGGLNVGGVFYEVDLDTSKMVRESRQADSALRGVEFRMGAVALAVKALAAALALIKMAQVADDMRLLSARVEVAAGSIERGAEAMNALARISVRTQTALADSVQVFTRLNSSIMQMGGTQQDTLRITDLLGMAIKVSGASAAEAGSAMTQFGQALGSGALQGDELRSLLENAPYLMRQLADGIGVPVGALKKLGEEGKLTADVVTTALGKAAGQIEADFKKLPRTLDAAMGALLDQLRRAAEAGDTLTGTSAAMTGAATGAGEAFDALATSLLNVTTESDRLGRSNTVQTWARATATAFSYVADAADFVVRYVQIMGRGIGGVAAAVTEFASGLSGASRVGSIVSDMRADMQQLAERPYIGSNMRQRWAALDTGTDGSDPMDRRARGGTGSTLKAPGGKPDPKAAREREQFQQRRMAAQEYLLGLQADTKQGLAKIDAEEDKALADNDARAQKEKANAETYAKARLAIQQRYLNDRVALLDEWLQREMKASEEAADQRAKQAKDEEAELKRQADARRAAIEYAASLTRAVNPVAALRDEYAAKLGIVREYELMMAQAGIDATQQAQAARTQITREYEAQRLALAEQSFRTQGEAQAFLVDSLNALKGTATSAIVGLLQGTTTAADAMRALGQTVLNEAVGALVQFGVQQVKNALLTDTLAAADKARGAANGAAYAASVGAQVAGMSAMAAQNAFAATAAIPVIGPGLAPAAAAAAAAQAAAIGSPAVASAPLAGARQYGGPVSAGSMYRVNETGAPEMFVGSGGRQYMLPTSSGQVVPADEVGGGSGGWTLIVEKLPAGLDIRPAGVDNERRIVRLAVAEISGQFRENSGEAWNALSGSSNVRGRF